MSVKVRSLVIALVLAVISSAIAATLLLLPYDSVPLVHRVMDLQSHFAAVEFAPQLGFGTPWYDATKNPDIGVIPIDEVSFGSKNKDLNQFPYPRRMYGTLLDHLAKAGAKAIVLDINFLEPAAIPENDILFAKGLKESPTVLAFPLNTTTTGSIGIQPPVASLLAASKGMGFSTVDQPGNTVIGQAMEIDTSGPGQHSNEAFTALTAAGVQLFLGKKLPLRTLPHDDDGRFLVVAPHGGPGETHEVQDEHGDQVEEQQAAFAGRGTLSFSFAYSESIKDLTPFAKGAIIFVGNTAQAQGDLVATARVPNYPGLFVNARLADQLLRGIYIRPIPTWVDVLLIIVLPLLIALSFNFMKTTIAIASSLGATLVFAYANLAIFVKTLYWIDLVHVVLAMVLATLFIGLYRILHEGAQRRMVTNLFGMHVSPAIVKDILTSDDPAGALALKGKKVKATIFYSDIRGFTAMSENMTPEEIYNQLNEYFEEMCAIIFQYGGYVDKFIGDCVMAVFSAPYQTPDDAKNAVLSAVAQQKKILELAEKWKAMGKREFTVGMGVNTGDVVMGNLGSSSRMNYTVIGDNVNLAARLYNVAKAGEIIISDYTYQEVKDLVVATPMEPVLVKGKKDPISIYNITDIKEGVATPPPHAPEPAHS